MNFDLDDNQQLLEETLLRFFATEADLDGVRDVFESDSGLDEDLWQQLAGLGLFGIAVTEDLGGSGLGLLDLVVAADVLGYNSAPGPFFEHIVAIEAISRLGSSDQRERWIPRLVEGGLRATVALCEPGERWLPEDWQMAGAELSGLKSAVLYPAGADLIVVGTRDGFVVVEGGTSGVAVIEQESLDRTRRIGSLEFDRVVGEPLAGGEVDKVVDVALVLLAADAAGGGRRCLEMATEYAKEREQFGVTIGHFQAVKHQLADLAVDVLPLRNLVWYAAHCFDNGLPDSTKFAALAKSHATDQYARAARRTVELYGGIGYTWECDVQFFLKRSVFDRAFLGAPSVHRARVARMNGWTSGE